MTNTETGNVYTDPTRGEILAELTRLLSGAPFLRSFSRRLMDLGVIISDKTLRHIAQGRVINYDAKINNKGWLLSRAKAEALLAAVQVLCEEDAGAMPRTPNSEIAPQLMAYDPATEAVLQELGRIVLGLHGQMTFNAMGRYLGSKHAHHHLSSIARGNFHKPLGTAGGGGYHISRQLAEKWAAQLKDMPLTGEEGKPWGRTPLRTRAQDLSSAQLVVLEYVHNLLAPFLANGRISGLKRRLKDLGYPRYHGLLSEIASGEYLKPESTFRLSDAGLAALLAGLVAAHQLERTDPVPVPKWGMPSELRRTVNARRKAANG